MAAKKITILLLPQGARRVRQIKVSKLLFVLLPLFFLSSALVLAAVIRDYVAVKRDLPSLAHLQKENARQREQLAALSLQMETIGKSLAELKKFDNRLRTMVNLETREDQTPFLGIGGSDPALMGQHPANDKAHRRMLKAMHQSMANIKREIDLQTTEKIELSKFLETQKSTLACTPSIWPTRGWVSSNFGYRVSPFTNQKEFHSGLDISTRSHTSIVSPAEGIVVEAGSDYGYGRVLYISHGYGFKTMYAHLDKVLVKVGQRVKRGDEIATVGSTGRTTGPHLHYEVHLNNLPVDPLRYILN
ncbi:MAG: M23 family metallopeptidase [Thermodesulfobacteriota bacterium]